jgi:NTP pyrophosphatase (non-canonical NTP hydrolase)
MKDDQVTLAELKKQIQEFCELRDWDPFHGAKDLAIGVVTEGSELLEHFRFLTPQQTEEKMKDAQIRQEVGEELADVLFFILRFAQKYNYPLAETFKKKMEKNNKKYPAELFRGKNLKSHLSIDPE